jgi:NADPH2:quinone reductase
MNAAVVEAFDRPPRYAEFADPVAGNGEVLVRVNAAGLHPIVKSLANGSHYGSSGDLPFVPGVDGVGRLEDGRRVYFGTTRSPYGSFAERGVTASWMCVPCLMRTMMLPLSRLPILRCLRGLLLPRGQNLSPARAF